MEFIDCQKKKYPHLASQYAVLGDTFNRKLYHELTLALEKFVQDENTRTGTILIDLYEKFIKLFDTKINQLKLVLICAEISQQYTDTHEAVKFLKSIMDGHESRLGPEASIVCLMKHMLLTLQIGGAENLSVVKLCLEENKEKVEGLVGAEPIVHSSFYFLACQYYLAVGPAELFYKNALMFLAYSPYEQMKPLERFELATNISLAALTGDGVFNFGEVLATPILKALEGTDKQWLSDLLHAFNRGDIDKFNEIVGTYHAEYDSQPALVNKRDYVKEKVALLALMELVFHRKPHDRNISFQSIAEMTRLSLDQVEWLVMRAMSFKLIKGSIDQVNQKVNVTWVQPRVLDNSQIAELGGLLSDWGSKVKETFLYVEEQTPELFQ